MLLKIAEDFKQYVGVPFTVIDVIIAGSNASFNYTEQSDLDLHLIVNFDSIECDRAAQELFDSKRRLYKKDHDLSIYNIPVEVYAEDLDHPAISSSYSVLNKQWIKHPNNNPPVTDPAELEHMVKVWDQVIQTVKDKNDLKSARNIMGLLVRYRQLGLELKDGEFSIPNLVYKRLRNSSSLKQLQSVIDDLHNQELSLKAGDNGTSA